MEDNISRQADEIEALSAIYNDEWCVIDEASRLFCIKISGSPEGAMPKFSVCLQVTLPPEYPSTSPPHYQLNAPWLRGQERLEISNSLEDIYCENLGESIIYLWVEAIREFVINKDESSNADGCDSNVNERLVTETAETDYEYAEDGFDWSEVQHQLQQTAQHNVTIESPKHVVQCPTIVHGEPVSDRRSTFQAHLAPVYYKQQVDMVMTELLQNKKIANATHNIVAYRIMTREDPTPLFVHGCEDDGETHAGSRMLHLLQIVDARNVIVVVSRWYGGIHLGPDRFKHINNCTRQILLKHGHIQEKEEKKKSKNKK